MNRLMTVLSALVTVVFLAGFSSAAGMEEEKPASGTAAGSFYSEDELRGLTVVDSTGEVIGRISEVSSDSESGTINFVTLSRGGILGLGAERHAVPVEALDIRTDTKEATLTVSLDRLETAPTQGMGMSDSEFRDVIHRHYGIAPAWQGPSEKTGEMMEESGMKPADPMMKEETAPQEKSY